MQRISCALLVSLLILLPVAVQAQKLVRLENPEIFKSSLDEGMTGEFYNPRICPLDPNLVAFELDSKGTRQLFIINLAKRDGLQQITSNNSVGRGLSGRRPSMSEWDADFDWCPRRDSQGRIWFAFVGYSYMGRHNIYVGNLDCDTTIRLTGYADNRSLNLRPRWSPDGRHLAYASTRSGNGDIYLFHRVDKMLNGPVPPDSMELDPERNFRLTASEAGETNPSWCPDSMALLIAYECRERDPETEYVSRSIKIVDVSRFDDKTKLPTQTLVLTPTNTKWKFFQPSWDPCECTRLAFYMTEYLPATTELSDTGRAVTGPQAIGMSQVSFGKEFTLIADRQAPFYTLDSKDAYPVVNNVVANSYCGPTWTDDGDRILFPTDRPEAGNPLKELRLRMIRKRDRTDYVDFGGSRYEMPRDVSITGDRVTYVYQEGKAIQMVRGSLPDHSCERKVGSGLCGPDSPSWEKYRQRYEGFLKRGPALPPGFLHKFWYGFMAKPMFGEKSYALIDRWGVVATAGAGVILYLILKSEKPNGVEKDRIGDPPPWPDKRSVFTLKLGSL